MALSDTYIKKANVFTREENYDSFNYSDGSDCENYLLHVIEKVKDLSIASPEWHQHIHDWPTKYHLSPQRADLLRPFREQLSSKNILEIGAGCGAITRFLGETGAQVTALEGSFRRARITAGRCRDLPGVQVVADNFQNFVPDRKYDFIILVGVLEYSNLFIESDDPACDLLKKAGDLLTPEGSVIIAIENKLGLKYWSGAPEDHIGKPFFGIENRYNDHTAETFGKAELNSLLHCSGFNSTEFLYAFPDYKLPSILLNDAAFETTGFDITNLILPATDHPQFKLYYPKFFIDRAWKQVIRNGLTRDMANSFVVVASRQGSRLQSPDILGYIYSSGRRAPFRKANIFVLDNNAVRVHREAINPSIFPPPGLPVSQKMVDEDYINGEIYFLKFLDIISRKNWKIDDLVSWSRPYYHLLKSLQTGEDPGLIDGRYLDLTPFNIIKSPDGSLQFFDQEWQTQEQIPVRYLFFRGIYFCFARPLFFFSPVAGTPVNVFEIITKIISAFEELPDTLAEDFTHLESRYFGPVSPDPDYSPVNFEINIFPEELSAADYLNAVSFVPLTDLHLKAYYTVGEDQFTELRSKSRTTRLTANPENIGIRLEVSEEIASQLKIQFSDKPGILKMYSCEVKDDLENIIYKWDRDSASPAQLIDIISIEGESAPAHFILAAISNSPALVIDISKTTAITSSRYYDIQIRLSVVERNESRQLIHGLKGLLAVHKHVSDADLPDASTRNDLATLVQRLSKNARLDLEQRISEAESLVAELESNITHQWEEIQRLTEIQKKQEAQQQEIERLKKDVEWYRRTYESRSLPGIVKDRFVNWLKGIYYWLIGFFLKSTFIRNRYALKYLLEYGRDNGFRRSMSAVKESFKKHGLKTITNLRSIALSNLQKSQAARSAAPVQSNASPVLTREKMLTDIKNWKHRPKISVILPTYNTRPSLLKKAIESVRNQVYKNWELCIADDGSSNIETKTHLKSYLKQERIKINFLNTNVGISAASNEAINLSSGEYLALFDHDDELTPDALYWICREINENPTVDIIYTDECKIDDEDKKSDYFLKPDWSPQLLLNMMYIGHLTVYRKSFLLDKVGLMRSEFDFSQDYDLALRATEKAMSIRHIKRVLYYWRQTEGSASVGDKPYARQTNLKALESALERRGIDGTVKELPTANRVQMNWFHFPLVSIIIPTDSYDNLNATIESILDITNYPNFEIVPVTNSGLISRLRTRFESDQEIKFVAYDKPYNFSDKCNEGAASCSGEVLLFLNDDVRPLQDDWIQNTIEYLFLPGVGGVSPKLVYENDTIQYAGMVTGVRNLTGTSFHCYPKDSTAYINYPQLTREVSILSGACLAMKKELFRKVGGFDAVNTPSAHSDVDLSFKILHEGLRCVYTPYAELRHIGHLSLKEYEEDKKSAKKDKSDIYLLKRWPEYMSSDPYFPATMRDLLYHDSPEPVSIYAPFKHTGEDSTRDIILVCHDLSRSGAPIMLYNICQVLLEDNFFVVVFCEKDGPLRKMYQQLGVTVIIDPLILKQHHSFERFASNFDYIICNTVVTWPIVKQMQDKVKTVWWLQEAKVINMFLDDNEFVHTLMRAKHIVGVSDYSLAVIKKYNRYWTKIYNACVDFYDPLQHSKPVSERIVITIVGSIESRKGHDILFDALKMLPEQIVDTLEIRVVGRVLDPAFYEMIKHKITGLNFIKFIGEVSNAASVQQVAESDIIVCPSRDDPFPVVLVEGFCMAKTCIVSDATGFAELIHHGQNGFVFANEDAQALAFNIMKATEQPEKLAEMGALARKVYEKHLSIPVLKRRLLPYLETMPEPGKNLPIKQIAPSAYTVLEGQKS
jgi:GT2 family glycosyltransferase/SAM-dependent methyltransferase